MKNLFLMLFATILATPALASEVSKFLGRYEGIGGKCSGQRIYVSLGHSVWSKKIPAITFKAYDANARYGEILLGEGQRQAPGTNPDIQGVVTEEWKTIVTDTALISSSTISRPSVNLVYNEQSSMVIQNGIVEFRFESNAPGAAVSTLCLMKRY